MKSVWIRLNPAMVGRLFPKRTVKGNGSAKKLLPALRVYSHKINGSMQIEATPFIPKKPFIIFDLDTPGGKRHFFGCDTEKKSANYERGFLNRPLPPPPRTPIEQTAALAAFDEAWKAFDEKYAMFGLRPKVDWKALRDEYRPLAAEAATVYEAAGAIALLVRPLRDLHVHVKANGNWVPGYNRCRMMNANWDMTKGAVNLAEEGRDLTWGRTGDGIGYVNVWRLTNGELPEMFDAALEALSDTWGLVLDLRFNGGGSEDLARGIAGRFIDRKRVYSTNRYRTGPKHKDLGKTLKRWCDPRGPWRYRGPVMVLQGQKTMSSAESFVLMMAQCPQVTTIGDRTAGSSANPRRIEVGSGITVNVPTWIDMDPKGNPIDEVGIPADVPIETVLDRFRNRDPVMQEALKRLRDTPKGRRKPSKK